MTIAMKPPKTAKEEGGGGREVRKSNIGGANSIKVHYTLVNVTMKPPCTTNLC
jgi:hypothetical protein